ncbi:helix-turn-helix domain-containing protein [Pseudoclavibacter sp. 13-3]|uniref:helix-turn-helix domain-containing protein n=1 Tax=Pseudoclavibacter sp. 13-3 TaxID=2901228 RepID=UPI001E2D5A1A|nr:helix-turn-helix domain-containing protein [Pseudoclavibacter sp. 13-3]MCD7101956.1 helix-turn-helix domain-containing protein [Pseudoclavibacter sp. 13-3]
MGSANVKGAVMRWAFRQPRLHPRLSPNAAHVLLALADRWNVDEGAAWPSVQDLHERTNVPVRTVKLATQELELRGIIGKRARVSAAGRKFGIVYELAFDSEVESDLESAFYYAKTQASDEAEAFEEAFGEQRDLGARDLADRLREMTPEQLKKVRPALAEARDQTYVASLKVLAAAFGPFGEGPGR